MYTGAGAERDGRLLGRKFVPVDSYCCAGRGHEEIGLVKTLAAREDQRHLLGATIFHRVPIGMEVAFDESERSRIRTTGNATMLLESRQPFTRSKISRDLFQ
jgi:hypothetical protein